MICLTGDPGDCVYLIEKGKVDIVLRGNGGVSYKVASYSGGAVFGETAFFELTSRSADVVAATGVDVHELNPAALERSESTMAREVRAQLYRNLASLGFNRLRSVNNVLLTLVG